MNDDAATEKLARVLTTWTVGPPENAWNCADALLPVVREIAAEELRAIYDAHRGGSGDMDCYELIERADALTKPPDDAPSSYCVEGWHSQCGDCTCACHATTPGASMTPHDPQCEMGLRYGPWTDCGCLARSAPEACDALADRLTKPPDGPVR